MKLPLTDVFAETVRRLDASRSDESAWKLLNACLWPLLLATSFHILRGNRHLAEDATQEALLRLFRYARFEDFRDNPEAFRSYALVICRNVCRRYLSQLFREPAYSGEVPEDRHETESLPGGDPELIAIRSNIFIRLFLDLDSEQRELLNLLLQGYSIAEIASRLGIKYTNTAVRIHRLRKDIAKSLKTERVI